MRDALDFLLSVFLLLAVTAALVAFAGLWLHLLAALFLLGWDVIA